VHRMPEDLIDDFLHDAVVLALEHDSIDHGRIANWLSIVAYRRFLTDRYRLSTRKTRQFPVVQGKDGSEVQIDFGSTGVDPSLRTETEDNLESLEREVEVLLSRLTPLQREALHLIGRTGSVRYASRVIGVSNQALYERLKKAKGTLGAYE